MKSALLALLLVTGCASHQTHMQWEYEAREVCSVYSNHPDWFSDCVDASVTGTSYWYVASWVGYLISLPVRVGVVFFVCGATPKHCNEVTGLF